MTPGMSALRAGILKFPSAILLKLLLLGLLPACNLVRFNDESLAENASAARLIPPGSIFGTVLADTNNDDAGEVPLADVTIELRDFSTDALITSNVSDETGIYTFADLAPGSYTVVEILPVGYNSVTPATVILVTVNADTPTIVDFLNEAPGSIVGQVWIDSDGYLATTDINGAPVIDTPLADVTISLLNAGGSEVLATTTTDSNGLYTFSGLSPGNYRVAETQPALYRASLSDKDTTLAQARAGASPDLIGDSAPLTVTANASNLGNDFIDFKQDCPDQFADWQDVWHDVLGAGNIGYGANPDNDRYDNLGEYAFCMPPNSGLVSPFILVPGAGTAMDGEFRRTASGAQDVTYSLEYTAALGLGTTTWSSLDIVVDAVSGNASARSNGDGTETVKIPNLATLTGLASGKGFVRISAVLAGNSSYHSRTEVLGWTNTVLRTNYTTFNYPLLATSVFSGTVDSVSGQDLSFATSTGPTANLANYLSVGTAYYLEVTACASGGPVGNRFDVSSVSGHVVTLANDSNLYLGSTVLLGSDPSTQTPYNTLTGAPPSTLAGCSVLIRPHWTLAQVFPSGSHLASATQATANEVQFYISGAYKSYWNYLNVGDPADLSDDRSYWVEATVATGGDFSDHGVGAMVVAPGQGMFFANRDPNGQILITSSGEVRSNLFIRPLANSSSLVGGGYPVDQSPTDTSPDTVVDSRQMNLSSGFFGSRDFKTADSIFVWRTDATAGVSGWETYWYLDTTPRTPTFQKWVKVGDVNLASKDGVTILLGDRAALIRAATAKPTYTMPCPWSP